MEEPVRGEDNPSIFLIPVIGAEKTELICPLVLIIGQTIGMAVIRISTIQNCSDECVGRQ
jgi:hypothetical protein